MSRELTELQALLVLNALPNIGPITTNRLVETLAGDPRRVFTANAKTLQAVRGVGPVIADTILGWGNHFDLAREEERLTKTGAEFITARDPRYPAALREIHDPPIGLYQKGGYRWDRPGVAIIGSRRTTLYGQTVAKRFAGELARAGFCVISGLARGIDTAAHEGALEAGGATAAVLGTGIDLIYPPENLDLYRRVEAGGALVSEFPFGRRADRQSFAMRNRIVSGLCAAVVVVESDVDGGSMITAKFAGEQGRHVFAVPGRIDQPTSAGCHQLIRDGAVLCTSVDDILAELQSLPGLHPAARTGLVKGAAAAANPSLTDAEAKIHAAFAGGEILTLDALLENTGLPYAELAPALMMLELKKLVAKRLDGTYEARG
ncbi:MAG TPA: DNA-processing protein DprA [Opitutaceae bacterium]|nr:DNA-processing protein DprA [Opitutaceae bacterium]